MLGVGWPDLVSAYRILVSETLCGSCSQEGFSYYTHWGSGFFFLGWYGCFHRLVRCFSMIIGAGCLESSALAQLVATNHMSWCGGFDWYCSADLCRCGCQVRSGAAACLAAGCDGRSNAGQRTNSRSDHGGCRRLPWLRASIR